MTDDKWNLVLDVNLKGVFNMTRLFGPLMEVNNYGSIINISSVVGVFGNIGQANYAATKAGVLGLTKTWAKEFARKGANVRVNAIAPGYCDTEMLASVPDKVMTQIVAQIPVGRLGDAAEIARAVAFLAKDDAAFITGETLAINGGQYMS